MIDITKLTQEQLWGLEFVVSQRNAEIKARNDAIPEGSGQEPEPLFTRAGYLESIIQSTCESWYGECLKFKEQMATNAAKQLPSETLQALFQQFGVPDAVNYDLIPE